MIIKNESFADTDTLTRLFKIIENSELKKKEPERQINHFQGSSLSQLGPGFYPSHN
jgi:hypothetical protein